MKKRKSERRIAKHCRIAFSREKYNNSKRSFLSQLRPPQSPVHVFVPFPRILSDQPQCPPNPNPQPLSPERPCRI